MTLLVKFLDVIIFSMLVELSPANCETEISGPAGQDLIALYVARGYSADDLSLQCVDPRALVVAAGVAL